SLPRCPRGPAASLSRPSRERTPRFLPPRVGTGGPGRPMLRAMNIPLLAARLRRRAGAPPTVARSAYALRRAISQEDWSGVRALRFAALAHHEDLAGDALRACGDAYDARAGTTTFLLLRDGTSLASTR